VESDLISWYLAEKYKSGMELIPDDAYDRLRMRWIIQENGKFIGLFYGFKGFKSKSTEEQQKHINSLNVTLHKMEQNLVLPYIMGQNFTLADILICPWLFRCCVFEKLF
jgi:glutathione S-transferase